MKILSVDDHPIIQDTLRLGLRKLSSKVELITAGSCKDGLRQLAEHPDTEIVLLDLKLPDTSGLEGLTRFRDDYPRTRVVVLSAEEDPDTISGAIDQGACGYIPKCSSLEVLIGALRFVLFARGVYIPTQAIRPKHPEESLEDAETRTARILSELGIEGRDKDILEKLAQGKLNKTIADELGLTESTVKAHLTQLFRALHVHNRTQAVLRIAALRLVFPPPDNP